jgi:hypothetical protein
MIPFPKELFTLQDQREPSYPTRILVRYVSPNNSPAALSPDGAESRDQIIFILGGSYRLRNCADSNVLLAPLSRILWLTAITMGTTPIVIAPAIEGSALHFIQNA